MCKRNCEDFIMKSFVFSLFFIMCFNTALADNTNKSFAQRGVDAFYSAGERFEDVYFIKHFLPCALIGYAFNEYPKQTLVFVAGILTYALYNNSKVRGLLYKFNILEEEDDEEAEETHVDQKKQKVVVKLEDDLFVY